MTETLGLSTGLGGAAVSFASAVLAGYPLLNWLRRAGVRQAVSSDAPERHAAKQGTPTMGGLMLFVGVGVGAACCWASGAFSPQSAAILSVTLAFGAIGWLDDWLIVSRGRNLGLTARQKLALQILVAVGFVLWLAGNGRDEATTRVAGVTLGTAYYVLCAVLIVGLSNATNLADGLDGLSSGMSAVVFAGLALLVGRSGWTAWVLAGACCGVLWFNVHPALVFMGNTGALALGAAMAAIGALHKVELPLIVATAMFWAETLSVMAQVAVFKWRKRTRGLEFARANRLFRRAPLHHHFEELGWPETCIVGRFWLLTAAATALAVLLGRTGWV